MMIDESFQSPFLDRQLPNQPSRSMIPHCDQQSPGEFIRYNFEETYSFQNFDYPTIEAIFPVNDRHFSVRAAVSSLQAAGGTSICWLSVFNSNLDLFQCLHLQTKDPNPNNLVASTTFYSETTRAMLSLVRVETDPADRTQLRMTVASGDPALTFEIPNNPHQFDVRD